MRRKQVSAADNETEASSFEQAKADGASEASEDQSVRELGCGDKCARHE